MQRHFLAIGCVVHTFAETEGDGRWILSYLDTKDKRLPEESVQDFTMSLALQALLVSMGYSNIA